MTSRRTKKSITYKCDRPGCNAKHVASIGAGFGEAWKTAKGEGWVAAEIDGKWLHFCSWVHRPNNDRQLREVVAGKEPGVVRHG